MLSSIADGDEISLHHPPSSQKSTEGSCMFPAIVLLPPPPLYRPFQQLSEKSSTDLKSKAATKKPAPNKAAPAGRIHHFVCPDILSGSLLSFILLVSFYKPLL